MRPDKAPDVQTILAQIKNRDGFLTEGDPQALANDPRTRLFPILVRCGGGRFTAPAAQVLHFVNIITTEGSDYVRDLSLVADYTSSV